MVAVGGATRLTHSGLSITEWQPIHGVIPPLNAAEWQEEFAKYQQIPEYKVLNQGMTLPEFKGIFWWEWSHRLLGRLIGFVVLLPLIFFWATGRIERSMVPKIVAMIVLGGLQGAIGWWMVASGLAVRTDVSQYRLATHLTFACLILAYVVWVARGLGSPAQPAAAGAEAGGEPHHRPRLPADLPRRPGRRARCGFLLQHLAADGRFAGAERPVHPASRPGAISSRTS